MSKLPSIVKNILVEAHLDFKNVHMDDDLSTINLKNLLSEINYGKDEINIIEASVLFEHFYKGYSEFIKSQSLDDERLLSDPISYYDELHKQYYDDIDFQRLDKDKGSYFVWWQTEHLITLSQQLLLPFLQLTTNQCKWTDFIGDKISSSSVEINHPYTEESS